MVHLNMIFKVCILRARAGRRLLFSNPRPAAHCDHIDSKLLTRARYLLFRAAVTVLRVVRYLYSVPQGGDKGHTLYVTMGYGVQNLPSTRIERYT